MDRKVVFDVDTGCDDALMLLTALASDALDVVGVTTVAGNTTLENTTRNTLALLEFADRPDIPVAAGCDRPLVDRLVTAEEIHGQDGLRVDLPAPSIDTVDTHAADFLIEQAREFGSDLTIAAVAPLSNMAVALAKEPRLPELVNEIYYLGGNATKTGNVTPMAAFNIYADASAASRVFRDGGLKVVELEVAEKAYLPRATIDAWRAAGGKREMIAELFHFTVEEAREKYGIDGAFMHDVLVAAQLIDDVMTFQEAYLEIDTSGGPSHGAVIWDKYETREVEPNAEIAMDIDSSAVVEIVTEALETWK